MSLYKQFGIYGILNKRNGMVYVGQTSVSFGDRRDCHIASLRGGYGVNPLLRDDWERYGESAFEFFVLRVCDESDDLDELERYYIAQFRNEGLCYNIGDGGQESPIKNTHLSAETKRRIGEKNRQHMLGKTESDETKSKMSAAQKRRWDNLDEDGKRQVINRMNNATRGVKWDDNKREEYSKSQREHPHGATHTADEVRRIRQMYDDGLGDIAFIAKCFNLSRSYVAHIISFRRWKYI